jgi:hypothetical protein
MASPLILKEYAGADMNKIALLLSVFFMAAFIVLSVAQYGPETQFHINVVIEFANDLSTTFLEKIVKEEKGGQFYLSESNYKELNHSLDELAKVLSQVKDSAEIKVTNILDPNNVTLLKDALACSQCTDAPAAAITTTIPNTVDKLKTILSIRVVMLQRLVPKAGPMSKDAIIQIDAQMTYLRRIAISYLPLNT